jgi:hypothetical protein
VSVIKTLTPDHRKKISAGLRELWAERRAGTWPARRKRRTRKQIAVDKELMKTRGEEPPPARRRKPAQKKHQGPGMWVATKDGRMRRVPERMPTAEALRIALAGRVRPLARRRDDDDDEYADRPASVSLW